MRLDVLTRMRTRLRAFRRDVSAVAALEFAIILPVMLLLYMGMTQVTIALNIDRKVTLLSRTVADLVGREGTLTTAQMNDIIAAAANVLAPYDATGLRIVLSSVVVRAGSGGGASSGTVCWSFSSPAGAARATNQAVAIPAGFDTPGSSFVLAEVSLPYDPIFRLDALFTTITLSDDTAWPVRNTAEVTFNGTACLPAPGGGAGGGSST